MKRPLRKKSVTIPLEGAHWSVEISRSGDEFEIALYYGDKVESTHAGACTAEENEALKDLFT